MPTAGYFIYNLSSILPINTCLRLPTFVVLYSYTQNDIFTIQATSSATEMPLTVITVFIILLLH